ncbi:hypothetical protein JCM30471_22440 [Desulfuromonas carbonis]
MPDYRDAISPTPALLPRPDLAAMIRLVRTLDQLSRQPAYRQQVLPQLPETARFNPGHDAVMMGYDFLLSPAGPRLIEVNTNAGGGLLAYLAHAPATPLATATLPPRLKRQLLASFAAEISAFSGGRRERPRGIAIIDENPLDQFLYTEMQSFARLFETEWGIPALITDPAGLVAGTEGVFSAGRPIDLIYNRHCDFYLESPAMSGLRDAYLAGKVCLTPNPFIYGLLADKRRMILWSDRDALADLALPAVARDRLLAMIPQSRLLAAIDPAQAWQQREELVFKPVSRFGSRGVLLGRKISRTRFDELPPAETLVQQLVPPSLTEIGSGIALKTDYRLYVYRSQVLGVAARLYQGQVTNLRTAGGGFAAVHLI